MFPLILFLSIWARLGFTPLPLPDVAAKAHETAPFAERPYVERVNWSSHRPLTWNDFKGKPDEANPHHALTAANLAVDTKWMQDDLKFQVNCVFLPTESWTKNTKSFSLLQHEQLHFNLTEVYARQMRKKLTYLRHTKQRDQVSKTVRSVFNDWKAAQHAFDTACEHGLNAAQQRQWAATISQQLQALNAYR